MRSNNYRTLLRIVFRAYRVNITFLYSKKIQKNQLCLQ